MFNFRLINASGNIQIIDTKLCTSYDSLTALQMQEYIEVDDVLNDIKRLESRKVKRDHKILSKLTCICAIIINICFIFSLLL